MEKQLRNVQITMVACGQFVVLTIFAMLVYAGGTGDNKTASGYTFFNNYFSDLGMTVAHSGRANTLSAILFFVALSVAGLGLILYFWQAPRLMSHTPAGTNLSRIGSFFGIIAGLGYIGVAFTPANLLLNPHVLFVQIAFLSFEIAVLFYIFAVFADGHYPKQMAVVYLVFAVALAAYLVLIFGNFDFGDNRLTISVTGQKLIVYAAIITMLIQANGSRRVLKGEL